MNPPGIKILFVEDDPNLGRLLSDYLRSVGYTVDYYRDGENALGQFLVHHRQYTICIVDCMLPGVDGFETAARLKAIHKTCPIILLTARSQREDKIKGFKLGVDDYVTKPFDEEELVLRIESILRRSGPAIKNLPAGHIAHIGGYEFDFANLSIRYQDHLRRVTRKEAGILRFLEANRNRVCRREEIMEDVWGKSDYFTGRSLDVFITKIRRYLKDDPRVDIENIHKVGYILNIKNPVGFQNL